MNMHLPKFGGTKFYKFTTVQTFKVGKIFLFFFKQISSVHQGCIYFENTVNTVILEILLKFKTAVFYVNIL